jgi:hypothetical protein
MFNKNLLSKQIEARCERKNCDAGHDSYMHIAATVTQS